MPEPDPTPTPNADPAAAFQRLLDKHNNDGVKLASQLFDENYQYRTQIRELKEKAPKEGGVMLTADEAKKWKAYSELGADPAEIKTALAKLPDIEKQNKELAGMETLRDLAEIGLDGSKLKISVLKDQIFGKYPDAAISFKTEKDKDGNEAKVAFIKSTSDTAEVPFSQFAGEQLADYLPALKVNAEAKQTQPGNTSDPKPQGGPSSIFDRIRETVKAEATKPAVNIDERFGRASA